MRILRTLPALLILATAVRAGDEGQDKGAGLTPYSAQEIDNALKQFAAVYRDPRQPEADALSVLEDMKKAYRYLDSKKDRSTDDEALQKRIIRDICAGLRIRKRDQVTLGCVKALGELAVPSSNRYLLNWMDHTALDAKNLNPKWVEEGFLAMAKIGEDDSQTIKMLISYSTGRHPDLSVTNSALRSIPLWRHLSGKNRKDLFEKVMLYLGGLFSSQHKSGNAGRTAKDRWDRFKESGMDALNELAGQKFADPAAATEWWKDNKRRRWEDFIGRPYRKQKKEEKKEAKGAS